MNNSTEKEWSRVNRIRAELSGLPFSDVATRIDQLRREGESTTVIAMLEFHYRLSRPIELRPGRRLANRYTIKRKIGEGGMGVVYEAVQDLTQQEVALKVIHPSLVSPPLIKRFREEIRTLGKLQHDHIVHVFDADYDRNDPANHNQDQLFYAMQLVQGLPLIRWVNESCPTVEAQLECFIQICEAVDYAHRRGVVHRDLKPDNILVDAGGRPAIMDFGLAQIADLVLDAPEGSLAPDGQSLPQVSGTPAFMSAERWEGLPGGVPADVFALGVLLHEMLTGIRPWNVVPNASIHDLRLAICNFTADQLEEHPALTAPFTRLLCSMLAPDPKARPATAAQVASAIRSIVARRRLRQRIRRGVPIWVGVTVAVGSVIATQSYYAWLKAQERDSEHRLRQASQIVEQRSKVDTLAQVITLLPKTPRLRHSQDQWREVVLEAMANWNINPRGAVSLPSGFEPKASDQKGTCFFGVNATGVGELIEWRGGAWVSRQFPGQQDFLRVRINSRRGELAALTRTAGLVVWRWNQNQPAALLPAAETTSQFEFSQDGRYLACSVNNPGSQGDDSEKVSAVRIFETETLKEVAFLFRPGDQPEPGSPVYLHSRPVAGMAFSPDGEHLAVWSHESLYLLIWEWSKERLVHFAAHRDRLVAAAWRPAPEEGDVATIQANGQILFWILSTTPKNGVYLSPEDALEWGWAGPGFDNQLAWTPRGEALAAANAVNQSLEIFCPDAGAGQFSVRLGDSGSRGMRWLSGGLVTHGKNHQEWIPFDSDPPVRRILRMPNFRPSHLAFNPAGTLLAAADNSRAVLISTITGKTLLSSNMPLSGPVTFDAISGELWVYDKINGPTRWAVSGSGNELTSLVGVRAIGPSYVGQLAATEDIWCTAEEPTSSSLQRKVRSTSTRRCPTSPSISHPNNLRSAQTVSRLPPFGRILCVRRCGTGWRAEVGPRSS
jgi:serine/threonine protein kinase